MPKALFIDTSRCMACRGCQAACKEWRGLPSAPTKQQGSHQNPPDLGPFNYKLVRFTEETVGGRLQWLFFPDQCHHCLYPACKGAADAFMLGAIVVDKETGAVICTEKTAGLTADQCMAIRKSCPYDIPRRNDETGLLTKCDMCLDRLQANLEPACVKTCPTGAMNFGERAGMLALARGRLEAVKISHPRVRLVDPDEVAVIFLVTDPATARFKPQKLAAGSYSRRELLANFVTPFRRAGG